MHVCGVQRHTLHIAEFFCKNRNSFRRNLGGKRLFVCVFPGARSHGFAGLSLSARPSYDLHMTAHVYTKHRVALDLPCAPTVSLHAFYSVSLVLGKKYKEKDVVRISEEQTPVIRTRLASSTRTRASAMLRRVSPLAY